MKPETVPDAGQIVETTTRRRIVPLAEQSQQPNLWEYLRSISDSEWSKHIVYVYRVEPAPTLPLLKIVSAIATFPGNHQVLVADQEEMEFALMQHFGGGTFRVIVKKNREWKTQERIAINAPVRAIAPQPMAADSTSGNAPTISPVAGTMDPATTIAVRAIDTVAGQEKEAVSIGLQAMATAANVVKSFANGGGNESEFDRALKQAMINRLLAPPPDPMEALGKLLVVMRELNSASGATPGGVGGDLVTRVLGAIVDRGLNPQPAGAPVSASAELVRSLPQLGSTVAEGLREFRMAREAELRMMDMARTAPVRPAGAPAPNPQLIPPAMPATAAPPAAPPTNGAPTMEFVYRKIVEILQRPISASMAADEAMTFLDEISPSSDKAPGAIEELAKLGEEGLLKMFGTIPELKPATGNMPRLVEFIRAFLKMHAEDLAAAHVGDSAKPAGPMPN